MDKSQNKKYFDYAAHFNVKIGVLSDTHSHINPTILGYLSGCDIILHAGDIGSTNIIKQLQEISNNVVSVCGNNDTTHQWNVTEHQDLEKIPQIAEVKLPGGIIVITHGDEYFSDYGTWHEKLRTNFPTAKAIVYGHSHRLVCDQSEKPWVLNPGAAGETRIQKNGVSCLLILASYEEWKVAEFKDQ
jgi:putative phosphoesterase